MVCGCSGLFPPLCATAGAAHAESVSNPTRPTANTETSFTVRFILLSLYAPEVSQYRRPHFRFGSQAFQHAFEVTQRADDRTARLGKDAFGINEHSLHPRSARAFYVGVVVVAHVDRRFGRTAGQEHGPEENLRRGLPALRLPGGKGEMESIGEAQLGGAPGQAGLAVGEQPHDA